MSKIFFMLYAMGNLLLPGHAFGWATPEQNINNNGKLKMNIGGSIKVHQGNQWDNIENITIDGHYSQIQMRVLPESLPSVVLNQQTGKNEIILKDDPAGRSGYTILKIDLAEIKSIQAVASLVYLYKSQVGNVSHTSTYVELIITPKDGAIKPYHCLVPDTVKLKWGQESTAGQLNMEVSLGSVELLEITSMSKMETH